MAGETEFRWTSRFSHASSINSKIFFAKTCGYLLSLALVREVFGGLPIVQLEFQTRVPWMLSEPAPEA
jgi:hypothetical protein